MLICFPLEKKPDWHNLPVMVVLILLINLAVFFVFQKDDVRYHTEAVNYYFDSGLGGIELPLYMYYLEQKKQYHFPPDMRQQLQTNPEVVLELFSMMRQDGAFMQALNSNKIMSRYHPYFKRWSEKHQTYLKLLQKDTTQAYGYLPGHSGLVNAFTSLFLHDSLPHLLGNMIFLCIFGISVEMIVGGVPFLLCYLLSGLGGIALYSALSSGGTVPLIGASGAIAGVVAMYSVYYGLRKIKIFYALLFFVNIIRASALWLLPIWLGWEIVQYILDSGTGVAYFAHMGGLLMGALLAAVTKRYLKSLNHEYIVATENRDDLEQQLARACTHIADLEFESAVPLLEELHRDHPEDERVAFQLYNTLSGMHAHQAVTRFIEQLFTRDQTSPAWLTMCHKVQHFYMMRLPSGEQPDAETFLTLSETFAQSGYLDYAKSVLERLAHFAVSPEETAHALSQLASAYRERQQVVEADACLAVVFEKLGGTEAAQGFNRRV